jgi:uncharacterized protein YkwD
VRKEIKKPTGDIYASDVAGITKLDVAGAYSSRGNISSLSGIEYFTALTRLECERNQLTALDVSKNTALTYLDCQFNQLTALDLSKNSNIKVIRCGNNPIKTVRDVILAKRAALEEFDFDNYADTSKPDTVTQTPAQQPQDAAAFEKEVLDLVNVERSKEGLQPLVWDDQLAAVARAHCVDMAQRRFFAHTNPDGLSPFDRMRNAGIAYRAAAENIAVGQSTPAGVVESWMNSPGHKANILNGRYTHIGIGFHNNYWTQVFTD